MSPIRFVRLGSVDERSECDDDERQFVAIELNPRCGEPAEIIDLHLSHTVTRTGWISVRRIAAS